MFESFYKAIELIVSGDPMLAGTVLRSLICSGLGTILACLWSLPISMAIASTTFRGKNLIKTVFAAFIGLPTVALGLILYLLLSNKGPLGFLQLLYTPAGLTLGQAILVTPLLCSFSISAIESVDVEIKDLARTLGANGAQTSLAIARESFSGVLLAIISAFNRAIGELGVAQMVGGNIRGYTSVMTTAIAQETARGDIELSIALTIILLLIVFFITAATQIFRRLS
jgi:tungstate transport system permease protein